MNDALIDRFFAAIEAGDVDLVRALYTPDAVIWHNDDLLEQSVEDNLRVLGGLHRVLSDLSYEVVRRADVEDGVLQQHVLRGSLPDGSQVALHCAMYLRVRDGKVARIEEYLDSAQRTPIREAREALQGRQ